MAHFTKHRLHYRDAKGVEKVAPAETVVFDLPEDQAERLMADGHVREASKAEIAEAAPAAVQKKAKAKPTTEDTHKGDDETQKGGDETQKGGEGSKRDEKEELA